MREVDSTKVVYDISYNDKLVGTYGLSNGEPVHVEVEPVHVEVCRYGIANKITSIRIVARHE